MDTDILFAQLSLVIALGAVISVFMKLLRQPLVIGYIITGILAGPAMLGIIKDESGFTILSTLGVALLLFIVGLELSLKIISKLSKVVFFTTFVQMSAVMIAGAAVARLFHFGRLESLIIGLCLAMSSTIIIVTLLQQKRELTRLFAQIAVGVLIVQDLVATAAKITLSARSGGDGVIEIALLLGRGALVVGALYACSRLLLPRVSKFIESSKELALVLAIGWALGIATLFAKLGFSIEVGALLAGMSLASLPLSHEVASRLRPMRDFFIIVFLITLGSSITYGQLQSALLPVLFFSLLVFLFKPFVILAALGVQGYTKRASFKAAIAMSQISEFSLVFIVAAAHHNYVSGLVQTVIGLTALVTFAGSAYLIKYDDKIFELLERHLQFFERRVTKFEQKNSNQHYPIVLFGYRKGGAEFIRTFKRMNKRFAVVDYDPEAVELVEKQHVTFLYGDASDPELIEELGLDKSKLIVSTISDPAANEFLAHWLSEHNPSAVFVASAESAYQAAKLYSEGASYVMMPHFIGSEKISTFIKRSNFKKSEFSKFREKHLQYLETHYSEEPA